MNRQSSRWNRLLKLLVGNTSWAVLLPIVALLMVLSNGIGHAEQVPPTALAEEIQETIEKLGAARFEDREAAEQRLWEFGLSALPAVERAAKSDDPEVMVRSRKVLEKLRLGILPDTPPAVAKTIREFHDGDLEQRRRVLRRLGNPGDQALRLRLMLSVPDPAQRLAFIREFGGSGDALLAALRQTDEPELERDLLAMFSARDWATYLLLRGEAEAEIARLVAQPEAGKEEVEAAKLTWLYLVTDQLAEARAVADRSDNDGVRQEVYYRQRDWKALVATKDAIPGDNGVEQFGFRAAFSALAGDDAAAQEAIDQLEKMDIADEYLARNCAVSLMINDRWDLAGERFARSKALTSEELVFRWERLDFEGILERLGVPAPGLGAHKVVETMVAAAVKPGADRKADAEQRRVYDLARSLAEFLIRVGEREEARKVLGAARGLGKANSTLLAYLAGVCRREGFATEAQELTLEALEAGEINICMGARFGADRLQAQLWWDYHRAVHPDEPVAERLRWVISVVEPEDGGAGQGEVEALIAEATKWISSRPADEQAGHYGALGGICLERGDWEDALAHYRKQAEHSNRPGAALLGAGHILAEREQWEQAAVQYAEAAAADPENELAVYLQGHVLVKAGRPEEGEELMEDAILMPVANTSRRNRFAFGLLRRGLKEAALEQWELVLRTASYRLWEGSESWALRSACTQLVPVLAKDDPERAADLVERSLHYFLKTNSSMTTRYYQIYRARIHALRFEGALAAGEIEQAIVLARKAMAARPGDSRIIGEAIVRMESMGRKDLADEWYESAAARYRRNLERFPKSAHDHGRLAWLSGRTGRNLEAALEHAEQALRMEPEKTAHLDALAEVSFRLGDREKALELVQRCIEMEPDDEYWKKQLARFQEEDGG